MRANEIRKQFPTYFVKNKMISQYCPGGALCMYLNNVGISEIKSSYGLWPNTKSLAGNLQRANRVLNDEKALYFATLIINSFDNGYNDESWNWMDIALTWFNDEGGASYGQATC